MDKFGNRFGPPRVGDEAEPHPTAGTLLVHAYLPTLHTWVGSTHSDTPGLVADGSGGAFTLLTLDCSRTVPSALTPASRIGEHSTSEGLRLEGFRVGIQGGRRLSANRIHRNGGSRPKSHGIARLTSSTATHGYVTGLELGPATAARPGDGCPITQDRATGLHEARPVESGSLPSPVPSPGARLAVVCLGDRGSSNLGSRSALPPLLAQRDNRNQRTESPR